MQVNHSQPASKACRLFCLLSAALEGRAPLCVALDDASALWPVGPRLARLAADRYLFFPACRRKFGLQARSLLEINR
jgi:hypothetical protein